jgi:hypothetical protein
MASTDAKAIPVKNTALRITFPILDADGDLVTGASSLDSEVSKDGGTFADCTNEATEIATASGMYYLDLTSGEMNGDTIAVIVKSGSGKTTPIVLYTAARSVNDLAYPTTTGRSIDVTAGGNVGIDWANVEAPTTTLGLSGTTIKDTTDVQTKLGTPAGASVSADLLVIDNFVDDLESRLTSTRAGYLDNLSAGAVALEATAQSILTDTAELGDSVGATLSADIAAVKADTAAILTDTAEIGAAGAGLTALASAANLATVAGYIDTEIGTILSNLATVDGVVDAIKLVADKLSGLALTNGTIGSTGNSTTALHLDGLTYGDDEITGHFLAILDVSNNEIHVREITDWVLSTELATVATLPFTPQNATDTYWILSATAAAGGTPPTAAAIADAVWDEAQADHVGVGTFGIVASEVADILVDTSTTLQGELDGIQADTEDIQSKIGTPAVTLAADIADLPTNAELATSQAAADDATLAAIAALNNLSAAQVNAEVDTALADIHLDHLLATTYDPASKPGAADALLNELVESDGGVARYTANALEQAPTGGSAPTAGEIADAVWDEATAGHTTSGTFGEQVKTDVDAILADTAELQGDWVNGGRLDLILDARASQTSVDDLPTNAELATSQAAADDATLAAIASLATSIDALPTNAELATALGTADDAVLAAIAALNNLSAAQVNAEVDTALADYDGPTHAELTAGLAAADDAVLAAIAALNNLSSAQLASAIAAGDDATLAALALVATDVDAVLALLDDARTEPGTGAPPVNPDLATKIDYLYKAWRNKKEQTSAAFTLYADDGTTPDQEATVSDDGTTTTVGEMGAP